MTKTKNTGFTVYDFMIDKLCLTGAPLLVYALIYSFTKAGNNCNGSIEYIGIRVGASCASVKRALNLLVDRGLIIKRSDPKMRTRIYRANLAATIGVDVELSKIDPPGTDRVGDIDLAVNESKMSHNNKEILKTTTTSTTNASQTEEDLFFIHLGDEKLVVMTMAQYLDLRKRLGNDILNYYISRLEGSLISCPGMYFKNHYRTILNWSREDARLE